jgi:chemotaxis protein CheD
VTVAVPDAPRTTYLQPGQVAVGSGGHILTILGSCVSVCLLDSRRRVGGMNHFLLPRGPSGSTAMRFGDVALPGLLRAVVAAGARREALEAKVFGGARILVPGSGGFDLGGENVAAAVGSLEAEGIPVVAQDTGGTRSRKLILQTSDGAVWLQAF